MTPKGLSHRAYELHGDDLASIRRGFEELAMPVHRRAAAYEIVSEVLEANDVSVFRWYKTEGTNELACYWDDAEVNTLWVTAGDVHVEVHTPRPARPTDWEKQGGKYVGWLLPGALPGTGGGRSEATIPTVVCPEAFVQQPAGIECPTCEVVHS